MIHVFYASKKTEEACNANQKAAETINRLINRQLGHGNNPEKLHAKHPIFSIKADEKARIIYTFHNELRDSTANLIPIILELDENHKYNSAYLETGVYRSFFESHTSEFKAALEDKITTPTETQHTQAIQPKIVHIIGKDTIVLDERQEGITVPAIIEGPPGSGKTCVAYVLLEQFAMNEKNAGKKVLYVTKSPRLADHIKALWQESPHYQKEQEESIQILSYDEMLGNMYPDLKFSGSARESVKEFLLKEKGYIGKNLSETKRQEKAENLFLEFRIISGFEDPKEYLTASENVTLYPKDQRQQVIEAYRAWRQANQTNYYQEFHRIDAGEKSYDLILSDEAQDFSYLELMNLMNLSGKNIVYCIDPKQNLKDTNSKIIYLQTLFYAGTNSTKITPIKLEGSYRCPPEIMRLAKEVNEMRLRLLPGGKQGAEITISGLKKGEVIWLETQDPKSFETITNLKHDRHTFIVTDELNQKKLLNEGFSRVFTSNEIKGLQSKTVVLYQPLNQDVFRKINATLGSIEEGNKVAIEENLQFSAPLCSLFTGITRAEERVIVFQTENEHLKNIIKPLKIKADKNGHQNQNAVINTAGALKQAKEFYDQGYKDQAKALLVNEVFCSDSQPANRAEDQFKQWEFKQSEVPKPTPPVPVNLPANPAKEVSRPQVKQAQEPGSSSLSYITNSHIRSELKNSILRVFDQTAKWADIRSITQEIHTPDLREILSANKKQLALFTDSLESIALKNSAFEEIVVEIICILKELDLDALWNMSTKLGKHEKTHDWTYLITDLVQAMAKEGSEHAAHLISVSSFEAAKNQISPTRKISFLTRAIAANELANNFRPEMREKLQMKFELTQAEKARRAHPDKNAVKKLKSFTEKFIALSLTDNDLNEFEKLSKTKEYLQMFDHQGEEVRNFYSATFQYFLEKIGEKKSKFHIYIINILEMVDPRILYNLGMALYNLEEAGTEVQNTMLDIFMRAARQEIDDAKIMMIETFSMIEPDLHPHEFISKYVSDTRKYANESQFIGKNYATRVNNTLSLWKDGETFKEALIQLNVKIAAKDSQALAKSTGELIILAMKLDHLCVYQKLIETHISLVKLRIKGIPFNLQEPETGMTVLHKIVSKREKNFHIVIHQILNEVSVDLTLRDNRGLSVFAILVLLKESNGLQVIIKKIPQQLEQLIEEIPPKFKPLSLEFLTGESFKKQVSKETFDRVSAVINEAKKPNSIMGQHRSQY